MASPSTPAGKNMSSRLLTMKFMQRAAASPSVPDTAPSEPPSKRKKLQHSHQTTTSTSAHATPSSLQREVEAALAEEAAKRERALERLAAEHGHIETKWAIEDDDSDASESVPHTSAPNVVNAGYAAIDASLAAVKVGGSPSEDAQITDAAVGSASALGSPIRGRKSFGNFGALATPSQPLAAPKDDNDTSSSSQGSSVDPEEDRGSRSKRKHGETRKGHDEKQNKAQLADRRRNAKTKLSQLESISSGGARKPAPGQGQSGACFLCGQRGHKKADCPRALGTKRA